MSQMRVKVGQSSWTIGTGDVENVVQSVKEAMESGTVAVLGLLDEGNRPVTVYLNGKVAETVVVDTDSGPRPTEIS